MNNPLIFLRKNSRVLLNFFKKNSPEMLMAGSAASSVAAIGYAIKATPKSVDQIKEKEKEKGSKLEKLEVVKTVWKNYIPTAVLETASIACMVGSGKIYRARNANLLAAYVIADNALKDYKKAVVDQVGTNTEADIRQEFAKKKVDDVSESGQLVEDLRTGKQKFCDPFGRVFITDISVVKNAINETNARMQREDYVSLNELYYMVGLASTKLGDSLGWNFNKDGFIEVDYVPVFDDDTGETTIYIDFGNNPPNMNFNSFNYY